MASSLALKRLLYSALVLPKSLRVTRQAAPPVQSAARLFNTNAVRDLGDDDEDERRLDAERRSNLSAFRRGEVDPNSSVLFNPFASTSSLSQILNVMDKFMDSPLAFASRMTGAGIHPSWTARETDDGLYLRMNMPGLGKENVKVSVEQNTLIIKGEGEEEPGDEESERRYSSRFDLPQKLYKTDQIKAEMKNGVLKVVVPKLKEEERPNVFHVKVE